MRVYLFSDIKALLVRSFIKRSFIIQSTLTIDARWMNVSSYARIASQLFPKHRDASLTISTPLRHADYSSSTVRVGNMLLGRSLTLSHVMP